MPSESPHVLFLCIADVHRTNVLWGLLCNIDFMH